MWHASLNDNLKYKELRHAISIRPYLTIIGKFGDVIKGWLHGRSDSDECLGVTSSGLEMGMLSGPCMSKNPWSSW